MAADTTSSAARYRKRPIVIEAVQWDGTAAGATTIIDWILSSGGAASYTCSNPDRCAETDGDTPHSIVIQTLEGPMRATLGDWVLRGVAGEFYPVKAGIFAATYEAATIDQQATTGGLLHPNLTDRILADVRAERGRQDVIWGEQTHPDGRFDTHVELEALHRAQRSCQLAATVAGSGLTLSESGLVPLSWRMLLEKEIAEAYANPTWTHRRQELIEAAAVIVAWIEDRDRRTAAAAGERRERLGGSRG